VDDAVRRTHVHHAVRDEGGRLDAARGLEVEAPGEPEPRDAPLVDLRERAVALLAPGTAVGQPRAGLVRRGAQPSVVDASRCCALHVRLRAFGGA
jgi:hypothetical protein